MDNLFDDKGNILTYEQVLEYLNQILIKSSFEYDDLISSDSKFEDFVQPGDEYDSETGELLDNHKEIPGCFKKLEKFFILTKHINILIDAGNSKGKEILQFIVDSHKYEEEQFIVDMIHRTIKQGR